MRRAPIACASSISSLPWLGATLIRRQAGRFARCKRRIEGVVAGHETVVEIVVDLGPKRVGLQAFHLEQLPWIEYAVGIEGRFDLPHQLDLDRLLRLRQEIALQPADAVLGADRAAEIEHDLIARRR